MNESESPTFTHQVRFYRCVLGVAYETGYRLTRLGVLEPDAKLDDGRPLFLLTAESIRKARERIREHRANISRTRHNLPILCQKKTTIP